MELKGNTRIDLILNVDTVNLILAGLSSMPYERVVGLITLIQQQAAPQINAAMNPVAPEEVADTL